MVISIGRCAFELSYLHLQTLKLDLFHSYRYITFLLDSGMTYNAMPLGPTLEGETFVIKVHSGLYIYLCYMEEMFIYI